MTGKQRLAVEHRATLVTEVAVLGVHVSSKVLLAVGHVAALVALKSVLVQSVLFTLKLGCECFGALFTFCPTFVSP